MTINEKQELKYLQIFIDNDIDVFSNTNFPKELKSTLGTGADAIINNFVRDGMISISYNNNYEFTETGKQRYALLKEQYTNENSKKIWRKVLDVITIATFLILIYSTWFNKHHRLNDNNSTMQPSKLNVPPLKTDTLQSK